MNRHFPTNLILNKAAILRNRLKFGNKVLFFCNHPMSDGASLLRLEFESQRALIV